MSEWYPPVIEVTKVFNDDTEKMIIEKILDDEYKLMWNSFKNQINKNLDNMGNVQIHLSTILKALEIIENRYEKS